MDLLLKFKLWLFKRFFKKLVGHNPNEAQCEMFRQAESGNNVSLQFPRFAGASTFLVIYSHWKKESGVRVIVIGSRHVRALAETYLKAKRRFPIILHNSTYASTLKPQLLVVDQSKDLSPKFQANVIDKLASEDGVKVVSIDTE